MYLYYARLSVEEIQFRALQGLGHFFVRYPRQLLKAGYLVTQFLSLSAKPRPKIQMLKNFIELLTAEDERTKRLANEENNRQSNNNNNNNNTATDEGNNNTSEEISLSGVGIIQTSVDKILPLVLDTDIQVRLNALTAIDLIIRQGLVNPLQVSAFSPQTTIVYTLHYN